MKKIILYILPILLVASCCKDESAIIPGQDFIPDEILDEIEANGQPIYDGYDPPKLEGTFFVSDLVKVESNFVDTANPYGFADETITFSDYNEDKLTLKIDYKQGGSIGEGLGSFISGKGNNFTIYVRIDVEDLNNGHTHLLTKVVSGTLEENGIRDISISIFMVDDKGDPHDRLIENGQGRRFKDSNNFSNKIN